MALLAGAAEECSAVEWPTKGKGKAKAEHDAVAVALVQCDCGPHGGGLCGGIAKARVAV